MNKRGGKSRYNIPTRPDAEDTETAIERDEPRLPLSNGTLIPPGQISEGDAQAHPPGKRGQLPTLDPTAQNLAASPNEIRSAARAQASGKGRWTCSKCDEPNRADRTTCNNCGESKVETKDLAGGKQAAAPKPDKKGSSAAVMLAKKVASTSKRKWADGTCE